MLKKIITTLSVGLCLCGITKGQNNNKLVFAELKHNFGIIEETTMGSSTKFNFINNTDHPAILTSVNASCGCTSPKWSTDTIWPGKQGFIEVTYHSKGRIGTFDKSIAVNYRTNAPYTEMLYISGDVVAEKPIDMPTNAYVQNYGRIIIENPLYSKDVIYDNANDTFFIRFFNKSNYAINVKYREELPNFISLSSTNFNIDPQSNLILKAIVHGDKVRTYGFEKFSLSFVTNHPINQYLGAELRWVRKQYFPKMSKRKLKKQAHFELSKTTLNYGKISDGKVRMDTLEIKNTGKQELKIHLFAPQCPCIIIPNYPTAVPPKSSIKVPIHFNPAYKFGDQTQTIYMVSNDPLKPEYEIILKAQMPAKPNAQQCADCVK